MAKKPTRDLNGILLLDKPYGMSSNHVLQRVKHLYFANKAGHTGSLDPLATGLLPICFGDATKFAQYLLESTKHYQTTMTLGIKTNTGDKEGDVIETLPVPALTTDQIEAVLKLFRGDIKQIPPMFSALKVKGKPLYDYARQGVELERTARDVTIYELKLLNHTANTIELDVLCSKGTYIRSLVEDIGKFLGCGAHVAELRRFGVGPYRAKPMVTLDTLLNDYENKKLSGLDAWLLPMESSLQEYPETTLSDLLFHYLRHARKIYLPHFQTQGLVRLLSKSGEFLGLGEVGEDGLLRPKQLLSINT